MPGPEMRKRWLAHVCAAGLIASALPACTAVKPYERELLAHPAMQQPVWRAKARRDQHVFEVREASRGAGGAAGGGCGCN